MQTREALSLAASNMFAQKLASQLNEFEGVLDRDASLSAMLQVAIGVAGLCADYQRFVVNGTHADVFHLTAEMEEFSRNSLVAVPIVPTLTLFQGQDDAQEGGDAETPYTG